MKPHVIDVSHWPETVRYMDKRSIYSESNEDGPTMHQHVSEELGSTSRMDIHRERYYNISGIRIIVESWVD